MKEMLKKVRDKDLVSRLGITLIEMLIAIFILGLIAVAIATFLSQGVNVWLAEEKQADITSRAKEAVGRMGREIKHTARGGIATNAAKDYELEFDVDLDNNGENETVKFKIYDADNDGEDELTREEGGNEYVLAENVKNKDKSTHLFNYYSSATGSEMSTPVSNPDYIRFIEIKLEMPEDIWVSSRVYLRNFKKIW